MVENSCSTESKDSEEQRLETDLDMGDQNIETEEEQPQEGEEKENAEENDDPPTPIKNQVIEQEENQLLELMIQNSCDMSGPDYNEGLEQIAGETREPGKETMQLTMHEYASKYPGVRSPMVPTPAESREATFVKNVINLCNIGFEERRLFTKGTKKITKEDRAKEFLQEDQEGYENWKNYIQNYENQDIPKVFEKNLQRLEEREPLHFGKNQAIHFGR